MAETLLFNALILYLTAKMEPAFVITNLFEALLGTLLMTALSTGVVGWLGLVGCSSGYGQSLHRQMLSAVVLSIGIATSVFTAVTIVRWMAARWLTNARPATLSI